MIGENSKTRFYPICAVCASLQMLVKIEMFLQYVPTGLSHFLQAKTEALERFQGYMDIGQKLKGIRYIFCKYLKGHGEFNKFYGYGNTMLSECWGYLPYLF